MPPGAWGTCGIGSDLYLAKITLGILAKHNPDRIADIKAYRPKSTSLSSGQVLPRGYAYEEGRVIAREMAEELALDMFAKGMTTNSISLFLSYSFAPTACRPRPAPGLPPQPR